MFGLSKSENQTASTSSLSSGARLGQDMGSKSYPDGQVADRGLTGFGNADNSDIAASSGNLNARSSYLPPQVAAPEVRAARYRVIDHARTPSSTDHYGNQGNARAMDRGRNGTRSYNRTPMKPNC